MRWTAYPQNVTPERRCQYFKPFPQLIEVPTLDNAWQMVYDCDGYPPEKTSIALHIFLKEWEAEFGISPRVRYNTHSILVEYSRDDKRGGGYDSSGAYLPIASYNGLTLTKGAVWVKIRSSGLLCESSLIHELVHASIWTLKVTDGDPDHLGTEYHGWTHRHNLLIQRTNEKLCRLGI